MAAAIKKPASSTGRYVVGIKDRFEHLGFLYHPGLENVVVDDSIADAMIAAGAVSTIRPEVLNPAEAE